MRVLSNQFAIPWRILMQNLSRKNELNFSGKFMTEGDVEDRVEQMVRTRQSMLARLEYQAAEDQKRQNPAKN